MSKTSFFRTSLIVVLTVLICTSVFLYLHYRAGQQPHPPLTAQVDVLFAGNTSRTIPLTIDGTIEPERMVTVAFEVSGLLEKGDVAAEPGTTFKKGQLLYQVNNREAFANLNKEKARLSTLLLQVMPDIEAQFPAEKNKWTRFLEELKPQFLLPELPRFASSKERYLMTERGVLPAFAQLQQSEVNMTKYFYLAPFDGVFLDAKEQPGNTILSGRRVARIASNGLLHITAPVPGNQLRAFGQEQLVHFCSPGGDTMGLAHFHHRSNIIDSQTRTMYHSFDLELHSSRRIFPGMPVKLVTQDQSPVKSCKVPAAALDGDLVQLVNNGQLQTRRITVLGRETDSILVEGLNDGDAVALSYNYHPDPRVKYYPVNKR